MFSVKN
jgi:hypothetical protein